MGFPDMTREKIVTQFLVDAEAPEDAEKYMAERALRQLGFEYAKKYASLPSVLYKYFDPMKQNYINFNQKLEKPRHLQYIGKLYEITIEAQ